MSEAFIKKNVKLSLEFDDYLVKHPQLFSEIPNGAYIVITLNGDRKFNEDSLSLVRDKRRKKIVEAHKTGSAWSIRPLERTAT
ncbi:MAG: DUF5647 family protein [Patescibacteria group bacterium]